MPRVKIDYIVSFSSEDPDNRADNLLEVEVGKKKWLCNAGEPNCSVVLQLQQAVEISSVQVGTIHVAFIEILVGRSERPNDPYEVLVPRAVVCTPRECRGGGGLERVRSWTGPELAAPGRWDRLRVVCSQPYDKYTKYGLGFIQVYSVEKEAPCRAALPARLLAAAAASSDEEEFTPGELFARHRQSDAHNADAQIRQASSQAIKNISDAATKLVKTPFASKTNSKQNDNSPVATQNNRQSDRLMYTDDDDKPHTKIDHIVKRHKDEKSKQSSDKDKHENKNRDRPNISVSKNESDKSPKAVKNENKCDKPEKRKSKTLADTPTLNRNKRDEGGTSREQTNTNNTSGRRNSDTRSEETPSRPPKRNHSQQDGGCLRGVVFALSGFVHPERGRLRDAALALGADYRRDLTPDCTHLICAFPNTPKLRSLRPGGGCVGVRAEWVAHSALAGRALPAPPYHPALPTPTPPTPHTSPQPHEEDTDDEIERVISKQKRRKTESAAPTDTAPPTLAKTATTTESSPAKHDTDDDITFVADERFKGHVSLCGSEEEATDEEVQKAPPAELEAARLLPDMFRGDTFLVAGDVAPRDRQLLQRYLRAYGGLVVEEGSCLTNDEESLLVVSTSRPGTVTPNWVWECHQRRTRVDPASYLTT